MAKNKNDLQKIKLDPNRIKKVATKEDSFSGGWPKSERSSSQNPLDNQPDTPKTNPPPKAARSDLFRSRATELEELMRGGTTSSNTESDTSSNDEKTPSIESSQREKSQSRRSQPTISLPSPTQVSEENTPSAELSQSRRQSESASSHDAALPFLSEIKKPSQLNVLKPTVKNVEPVTAPPRPNPTQPTMQEKKQRPATSAKELDEKYNPPKPEFVPKKSSTPVRLPPITTPPSAFQSAGPLHDPAAPPFLSAWDKARQKNLAQEAAKTTSFDRTSLLSAIKNQNDSQEQPLHVMDVDSRKKVENYLNNYSKGLSRLMTEKAENLAAVLPEIPVIDISKILSECTTKGARIVATGLIGDLLQKIPKVEKLHLIVDNLETDEVAQLAAALKNRAGKSYPPIKQLEVYGDVSATKLDEISKALIQQQAAEAKPASHRQQPGLFNKHQPQAAQPVGEETHKRKPSR